MQTLGEFFSRIVIRAHILYSKIAALQPEPVNCLLAFLELEHPTDNEMTQAEDFLVVRLRGGL